MQTNKKSIFDSPLLSTKIKSANVTLFPEGALGYLVGPTFALLANSILAGYFTKYMTDVLNLNTWAAAFMSMLPIVSVIFVIFGNILVGRLMDHSKTRAGKARPFLLLSVPISLLALLVLFILSPFPTEGGNNIITLFCVAVGYNLWFAIAYPFYFTPHSALVNLSTRNSKDRSLLATISNATALAAMGIGNMVLPFFLGMLFVKTENGFDQIASYNAWKVFSIGLIVITFLGVLVEYFFTRERITEESFAIAEKTEVKAVPIGEQIKVCFSDKLWWIMMLFFFLYQFGGMMKNISQIYFMQAMWFENYEALQGTLSIIGAIPTALGMVIAWPLSNKIGKGRAILLGAILAVVGGMIGFIAPDNFYCVVASFVIKALGSTPAMYLSLALLADVLDHQEAKHKFRTDGFTMTIYGAIMAGMTGLVTGIVLAIIGAMGYDAANAVTLTSASMQTALKWVFIGGETICYLVIAVIMIFMNVEKHSDEDHKTILANQKAAVEAAGGVWEDPADRLKREEAEAAAAAEEARKAELKAKCDKKGLNFEEEEGKYQAALAAKAAKQQAALAAKEAKKKK